MSLSNCLILEGTICKAVQSKRSPAGVPHTHFLLEHRSIQIEANLKRQAWCKISVVASGDQLQSVSQSLVMGTKVQVKGFISSHQSKSGLPKLVLHAEQITILTHGE